MWFLKTSFIFDQSSILDLIDHKILLSRFNRLFHCLKHSLKKNFEEIFEVIPILVVI